MQIILNFLRRFAWVVIYASAIAVCFWFIDLLSKL